MPVRAIASVPSLPSIGGPLTASDVSVGTSYEVTTATEPGGPGLIQLKRVTDFPTSRPIAAASSEYGWSWRNNAGVFTSADDNTSTTGASTWRFNTTSVDQFGGTQTAPIRYRLLDLSAGQVLEVVTRVVSTAQRNFEFAGLIVASTKTWTNWTRVTAGYSSLLGGYVLATMDSSIGPSDTVAATSTQINTNGVWMRAVFTLDHYVTSYSVADQAEPPSTWVTMKRGVPTSDWAAAPSAPSNLTLAVGMTGYNVNTSGDYVAKFKYWRARVFDQMIQPAPFEWGTELFSTAGPEQLVGEVDFGSAVALNQAKLRQILADSVNTRPNDSATVTFSVVGGSSTGPASGTYYAAGSVVVSGSYRYWRVYLKITSATGVEQGSVRLPISLPTSA